LFGKNVPGKPEPLRPNIAGSTPIEVRTALPQRDTRCSRSENPTRRPTALNAMVRWVNHAMSFAMVLAFLAIFAVKLR